MRGRASRLKSRKGSETAKYRRRESIFRIFLFPGVSTERENRILLQDHHDNRPSIRTSYLVTGGKGECKKSDTVGKTKSEKRRKECRATTTD